MAGEVTEDPVVKETTQALKAGGGAADTRHAEAVAAANRELIAHRIVQILIGQHRGRTYFTA